MAKTKHSSQINFAQICKYLRLKDGYCQKTFATLLNTTPSTISRVENGLLEVPLYLWFEISKKYNLTHNDAINGFLDNYSDIEDIDFLNEDLCDRFKIPNEYCETPASTGRTILPFLKFTHSVYGPQKSRDFLKRFKVDPIYFSQLDNKINIRYVLDLTRALIQDSKLKPNNIGILRNLLSNNNIHGNLKQVYESHEIKINRKLELFIENSNKYDKNTTYEYSYKDKKTLQIIIRPTELLKGTGYIDNTLQDYMGVYKKEYYKEFIRTNNNGNLLDIEQVESPYRQRSNKWVYEVKL